MVTATANITRGKTVTENMSEAGGLGKCEINGGRATTRGPRKLMIRLDLVRRPEADNQITGKRARTPRPGSEP
jgi:hypothetical protein